MNGFFFRLNEALRRGPAALATVTAAHGSTPRVAGARQFLAIDGGTAGTIGGGATESRVLGLMRETLADGGPRTFEADLRGRPGDIRDGVCGGTMRIDIVRLAPETDGAVVAAVDADLRAGRCVTLFTRRAESAPLTLGSEPDAFVETLEPPPHLLVIGAGHIGRCLARLAAELDFAVTLQDDRADWLEDAVLPPDCLRRPRLDDAVAALRAWQGDRLAALVTRGFALDVEAMGALAATPGLNYLGLLGSRKRVATVLAAHREAGRPPISPEILHAPIGFEIGAETPEEIAVSIAAELIRVRRERREAAVRFGA